MVKVYSRADSLDKLEQVGRGIIEYDLRTVKSGNCRRRILMALPRLCSEVKGSTRRKYRLALAWQGLWWLHSR